MIASSGRIVAMRPNASPTTAANPIARRVVAERSHSMSAANAIVTRHRTLTWFIHVPAMNSAM